jgi:hypothetical protein
MKKIQYSLFERMMIWLFGLIAYAMGLLAVYGVVIVFDSSPWWLLPFVLFFIPVAKDTAYAMVDGKCQYSASASAPDTEFDSFRMRHKDYMRGYYWSDDDDD